MKLCEIEKVELLYAYAHGGCRVWKVFYTDFRGMPNYVCIEAENELAAASRYLHQHNTRLTDVERNWSQPYKTIKAMLIAEHALEE